MLWALFDSENSSEVYLLGLSGLLPNIKLEAMLYCWATLTVFSARHRSTAMHEEKETNRRTVGFLLHDLHRLGMSDLSMVLQIFFCFSVSFLFYLWHCRSILEKGFYCQGESLTKNPLHAFLEIDIWDWRDTQSTSKNCRLCESSSTLRTRLPAIWLYYTSGDGWNRN